jgi:hypothetical protein
VYDTRPDAINTTSGRRYGEPARLIGLGFGTVAPIVLTPYDSRAKKEKPRPGSRSVTPCGWPRVLERIGWARVRRKGGDLLMLHKCEIALKTCIAPQRNARETSRATLAGHHRRKRNKGLPGRSWREQFGLPLRRELGERERGGILALASGLDPSGLVTFGPEERIPLTRRKEREPIPPKMT